MSTPRYDWWPYVKGMIRRYPELCRQRAELQSISLAPALSGMPRARGRHSDPVADAVSRELPAINRRELEAVQQALNETLKLPDGAERLTMVRLVFWENRCTLEGAALILHRCHRTLCQWHGDFIREVARAFGLL